MKKTLWILILGHLILIWIPFFSSSGVATDFELFLGRFHPSLVHFPIGILIIAIGFTLFRLIARVSGLRESIGLLLYAGAWAAVIASSAGLLLARDGGYDAFTLYWHRTIGILIATVASVIWILWDDPSRWRRNRLIGAALLGVLVLLISVGGHLGGSMSYQEGYLTRYMPDLVRTSIGLPLKSEIGRVYLDDPSTATVFETFIQPVFENRCVSCHNEDLNRGSLSLVSMESINSGGSDGPPLLPGNASESLLFKRIGLPLSHTDHMPPEGKPQVSIAEAELIRWWINSGASFEETLDESDPTAAIQSLFLAYGLGQRLTGIFALSLPWPDTSAVTLARNAGLQVSFLSQDVPFLDIICTGEKECLGEDQRNVLVPLQEYIALFNASENALTDSAMSVLSGFKHLVHVRLENTGITDEDLQYLQDLEFLEVINVYGTTVSDTGLNTLLDLPALRSVYVWQTQVTRAGVTSFRTFKPDVDVVLGSGNE